jgi:hypothetical protein
LFDNFSLLEQSIMNRNRSQRQRPISFEALEGRLALSTGMGIAAVAHRGHALVMNPSHVPASFKAHVQINGTTLTVTNLRGRIGTDHMTGSGTGTVAGKQFEGGTISLSNNLGSVELELGSAFFVKPKDRKFRSLCSTRPASTLRSSASTGC